jgi:hypothetical protein
MILAACRLVSDPIAIAFLLVAGVGVGAYIATGGRR